MGIATAAGGSAGERRARRRSARPMSEINVTPMVDVMLVLLIIFMVTAPLLTVGVESARCPSSCRNRKPRPLEGDKEPLTVTVDPEGKIFLQDTEISSTKLCPNSPLSVTPAGHSASSCAATTGRITASSAGDGAHQAAGFPGPS